MISTLVMAVGEPQTLLLASLAVLAVVYIVKWQTDPLRSIPTVGGPSAPGLSFLAAYNWMHNSKKLISEGCQKHYGSVFKVALFDRWLVLVSGPKLIEQLVRRPDNELSGLEGNTTFTQLRSIASADSLLDDPFHIDIIKEKLTRTLPIIFPEIVDEVKFALSTCITTKDDEWITVNSLTTMKEIVIRASSRIFVGDQLCRNKEYLELALRFSLDVIQGRSHLNFVPSLLKPVLSPLVSKSHRTLRIAMKFIEPFINERRAKIEELVGEDWSDKPNDMLQWLIEEALSRKCTDYGLVERIFLVNFAAIDTSTTSTTRTLYDLAAMPEHIPELREEIESIIATDGWTKAAMGKMWKLDSIIKESMRTHASLVGLFRTAMKDITLSDGTFIPKGTLVAAATEPVHRNESIYANPDVYDPFRFAKMREDDGGSLKHQLTNTSYDFLPFSHGKHACPGRFFAASELKTILALIILNYDLKLGGDGKRPQDRFRASSAMPLTEPLFFRKRQAIAGP